MQETKSLILKYQTFERYIDWLKMRYIGIIRYIERLKKRDDDDSFHPDFANTTNYLPVRQVAPEQVSDCQRCLACRRLASRCLMLPLVSRSHLTVHHAAPPMSRVDEGREECGDGGNALCLDSHLTFLRCHLALALKRFALHVPLSLPSLNTY